MRIKKFRKYCESISGTELMGDVGPAYGREKLPTTINQGDTNVLYSELTDKFYTEDDFQDIYQDYLKKGGGPLITGFNKENLDNILMILRK